MNSTATPRLVSVRASSLVPGNVCHVDGLVVTVVSTKMKCVYSGQGRYQRTSVYVSVTFAEGATGLYVPSQWIKIER